MSGSGFNFDNEAAQTNAELSSQMQQFGPLSAADMAQLFPTPQDQAAVKQLIDIVNSSATQNAKVAALQTNVQQLGGVVIKLLGRLM
jgi:hypothetical protein